MLTMPQVVYFHAGSQLSYRKIQSNSDAKGSFTSIPVIDISKIDSPLLDDKKQIASQLHEACSASGFFYIDNHGVRKIWTTFLITSHADTSSYRSPLLSKQRSSTR